MNDTEIIVGSVEYGSDPPVFSEKHTMMFTIKGVQELADEMHETPEILCHGHRWYLEIYPYGSDKTKALEKDATYFTMYLCCADVTRREIKSIGAKWTSRLGSTTQASTPSWTFSKKSNGIGHRWPRDKILLCCNAVGTLLVKVDLQVDQNSIYSWKPPRELSTNLLKHFESQATATNVDLVVGEHRIGVHRVILAVHGSHLATIGEESSGVVAEIPMDGEDFQLIEMLVRFLYKETLPDNFDDEADALNLLKVADKYGFVNLKMLLEARVVQAKHIIRADSAVEILLFAESHNCALLRETAMKMVVNKMPEIRGKSGWDDIFKCPELAQDLFRYQSECSKPWDGNDKLDRLGVAVLRARAAEKGLEVDGSRTVLIERLKMAERSVQ